MVRTARFAFDDHRGVHRRPLDELDADADDCCFDLPETAAARDQNKPTVTANIAADTAASIDGTGPSSPVSARNSPPSKAA